MFVIGVAGRIASGKTEIASFLARKYGAKVFRLSDTFVEILRRLGLPEEREKLQKLASSLREVLGEKALIDHWRAAISALEARVVVVDGVRHREEVGMLKDFGGSLLIFVEAPAELRYKRFKLRVGKGEERLSWQEFKRIDEAKTEREIDQLKEAAEIRVRNDSSTEELFSRVEEALRPYAERLRTAQ